MSEALPDPLVPLEVDLRDFGFMPLHVSNLRDSELVDLSTGPEFKAAVLLWCYAWHQQPAGSLPKDDRILAARSGAAQTWRKVKAMALRGFVECSDGRLYHPVIAEAAVDAWARRDTYQANKANRETRQQRWRAECTRLAGLLRDAGVTPPAKPTKAQLVSLCRLHATGFVDAYIDGDVDVHVDGGETHVDAGEMRKTGTGTGTGTKKKEKHLSAGADPTPTIPCPYARIVELYHETLPGLPRVKLMPATRQRALRKVWGWVLSTSKGDGTRRAETADQALHWFATYFGKASENDFLMGRTQRAAEHANWRCDLDFLLTDKGMKHVIEKTEAAA